MQRPNIGLITNRTQEISGEWSNVVDGVAQHRSVSSKEVTYLFPLYLYPEQPGQPYRRADAIGAALQAIVKGGQVAANQVAAEQERVTALIKRLFPAAEYPRWPNFAPSFLAAVEERLGLAFMPDGRGDLLATFGPEDLFHYAYAVFHAPSYRARYAEFLKIDFPRLPLTGDLALFRTLAGYGADLVGRHLLTTAAPDAELARYPLPGSDRVEAGYPKYVAPIAGQSPLPQAGALAGQSPLPQASALPQSGRVYLNATQYFEGVPPEVWEFAIGGYQVAEKWLKDRRGRTLSYDERQHYRQTLAALAATIRLMGEIDAAIPGWPLP